MDSLHFPRMNIRSRGEDGVQLALVPTDSADSVVSSREDEEPCLLGACAQATLTSVTGH